VPDPEALEQVYDLLQHEGLSVAALGRHQRAAAIRVARQMGPGHTVVTILCDGGARYQSKLFNPAFLRERGLPGAAPGWPEGDAPWRSSSSPAPSAHATRPARPGSRP
jgi:cysteine synthase A